MQPEQIGTRVTSWRACGWWLHGPEEAAGYRVPHAHLPATSGPASASTVTVEESRHQPLLIHPLERQESQKYPHIREKRNDVLNDLILKSCEIRDRRRRVTEGGHGA